MTTIATIPPIPAVLTPPQVTAIFTNKTPMAIQIVNSGGEFGVLQPGDRFEFDLSLDMLTSGIAFDMVAPVGTVASPDGTQIMPPDGEVIAGNAYWSFGKMLSDGVNAVVLLNGKPPSTTAAWAGSVLRVDDGGNLYLKNGTSWRIWQGQTFAASPHAP